jgi:hypothetical protein
VTANLGFDVNVALGLSSGERVRGEVRVGMDVGVREVRGSAVDREVGGAGLVWTALSRWGELAHELALDASVARIATEALVGDQRLIMTEA